jgi:hypothetical protein
METSISSFIKKINPSIKIISESNTLINIDNIMLSSEKLPDDIFSLVNLVSSCLISSILSTPIEFDEPFQ